MSLPPSSEDVQIAYLYWGVILMAIVLLLRRVLQYGMRTKDLPPGPPTTPLLGNLLQMPTKNFHTGLQKLTQQYGPIMTMKLGGQNLFLLNDPTVVRDLIEKRQSNYSCRPNFYMRSFGDNLNIAMREYNTPRPRSLSHISIVQRTMGVACLVLQLTDEKSANSNDETWRRQRKMYHVRLNAKSADRYLPYQTFDSMQLLHDLVVRPDDWVEHVRRYTASISTTMLYGWRTPRTGTGYVKDLLEWVEVTSEALNFNLVDFYPFLKVIYDIVPHWILPSKHKLHELQKLENRVFYDLLNRSKDRLETGQAYPSFIRDMLEDKDNDRLTDRQIANNAAHGFGAAMDTSANTIMGFIKAMVLFPNVQAKAQEELDEVIGSDRLPTWDDRASLPYIRGVVEETLRWAPSPISGAVPHSAKEDDVYNGKTITKGSIVMMNIWTLNHDRYSDPRNFDPLRQDPALTLSENNAISQDSTRRLHFTFGAGRRVCPGLHVAQRNIFLAVSRMLWAFNIERQRDVYGRETPIDRDAIAPENGLIVRPADFECTITPRDSLRKKLIIDTWKDAEKSLDSEGNFKAEFIKASFGEV